LGNISKNLKKYFDIDQDVWICDIDLSKLYQLEIKENKYTKVSSYPSVERDFAILVDESISGEKILNLINQNAGKFLKNSYIFDVYQGKGIEDGNKSIAIKVILGSDDRTLNDEEIQISTKKIINSLTTKLNATLRD
ncbi:phenylalanine--tRNA ligase subunit beta, partial [Candidatus Kapabacteria bacterium]|nr:phenylalanine--tRNA ligase subunit beta [Candidatus Kapabacteria bacterium]